MRKAAEQHQSSLTLLIALCICFFICLFLSVSVPLSPSLSPSHPTSTASTYSSSAIYKKVQVPEKYILDMGNISKLQLASF